MRKRRARYDRILLCAALLLVLPVCCVFCTLHGRNAKPETAANDSAAPSDSGLTSEPVPIDLFTVVIDAGHGGEEDPGCISADGARMEKDDVLTISKLIESNLRSYPDIQVLMTRSTDVFVTLDDRCAIANDNNADLFVAVHRNSAPSGSGIEAWISNTTSGADHVLAEHILQALERVGVTENRGVSEGFRGEPDSNYRVNSGTRCPSCLLEVGFLTDAADNADFDLKKGQYAEAIAGAIVQTGTELGLYHREAP